MQGSTEHATTIRTCHRHPIRNQRKKRALAEARERSSALEAENASLLRQLDEQQREAYTVTEHFRQEVVSKNTEIARLQARGARG
jgi:hypothetical protein